MRISRVYIAILLIAVASTIVAFMLPRPGPSLQYEIVPAFSAGEKYTYTSNWSERSGNEIIEGRSVLEVSIVNESTENSTFTISIEERAEGGETSTLEILDSRTMHPLYTEVRSATTTEGGTASLIERVWWDHERGEIRVFIQGTGVVEEPINKTIRAERDIYDDWTQLFLLRSLRVENLTEGDSLKVKVLHLQRLLKNPKQALEAIEYKFLGHENLDVLNGTITCEKWEAELEVPQGGRARIAIWISADEDRLYVKGYALAHGGEGEEEYELASSCVLHEVTQEP